jgi:hypothetical protein
MTKPEDLFRAEKERAVTARNSQHARLLAEAKAAFDKLMAEGQAARKSGRPRKHPLPPLKTTSSRTPPKPPVAEVRAAPVVAPVAAPAPAPKPEARAAAKPAARPAPAAKPAAKAAADKRTAKSSRTQSASRSAKPASKAKAKSTKRR